LIQVAAVRSLKSRAIAALARREHSRQQLARKLAPHAESEEALEAVLDELVEKGFLSDARFAEALVRVRGERYGAARLALELREHGVPQDRSHEALESAKSTELARAQQVWARRFGLPPDSLEARAKQIRFLISRGFAPDTLRRLEANGFAPFEAALRTHPRTHSG
jgi:regulatory protein